MLSEKFLPSYKFNFGLQLLILIVFLYNVKAVITKTLFNLLLPLIIVFFLGFLGYLVNKNDFFGFVKDITYFLKPVIALLVSYLLVSKIKNQSAFYKAIVLFAIFTAFIHVFGILITGSFFKSVSNIRGDFGLDNFIEVFAFYILLFHKKFNKESLIKNKQILVISFIILLVSILFYFSRTMLVVFILVGLSILGYFKLTKKSLIVLIVFFAFTMLFFSYLNTVNLDRNSEGIESFLYKVKIAPEEIFKTKIDRENHKDLWDHWRGYEAKRAFALMNEDKKSYLIGTGYGSWVNLKFVAPLGENGMKHISRLHNGYVFVFYKLGLIGFLLYILFLLKLYFHTSKKENIFNHRLIGSIGVFYIFTSIVITGIYIPNDLIIFVLGGLIYFSDNYEKIKADKIYC